MQKPYVVCKYNERKTTDARTTASSVIYMKWDFPNNLQVRVPGHVVYILAIKSKLKQAADEKWEHYKMACSQEHILKFLSCLCTGLKFWYHFYDFYDLSALVGCWFSVSIRRIIYKFLNACPFDYTAVAVSGKVERS